MSAGATSGITTTERTIATVIPPDRAPTRCRPRIRRLAEFEPPVDEPGLTAPAVDLTAPPAPPPLVADPPDPTGRAAAGQVLRALIEVVAGLRPLQQLRAVLADEPFALLQAVHGRRRSAVLRTFRSCQPTAGVVEASAVYQLGDRYRAVAARFEADDAPAADGRKRWRCTVLQLL